MRLTLRKTSHLGTKKLSFLSRFLEVEKKKAQTNPKVPSSIQHFSDESESPEFHHQDHEAFA